MREGRGGRRRTEVCWGRGDMRRKKKETDKGKEEGGKQIHRGYCFDRCGYVVAVVREREKERERGGSVLVWYYRKVGGKERKGERRERLGEGEEG